LSSYFFILRLLLILVIKFSFSSRPFLIFSILYRLSFIVLILFQIIYEGSPFILYAKPKYIQNNESAYDR
jgi:hypothetical protein